MYHDNYSQGRLLYGVISEESIASFVLAMVDRRGNAPKNTLDFPPAFKAYKRPPKRATRKTVSYEDIDTAPDKGSDVTGSTIDNDDDGEYEGVTKYTSRNQKPAKLEDYVRLAVFHILQLARPEYIFFCRSLPAAYITEYLFHQEHLSFLRFFHHITLNFFHNHAITFPLAVPPPVLANPVCTNKWCVFTRTSRELLRIHVDRSIQKLLLSPLEDVDILLDKQDEFFNHNNNNSQINITKSFAEKRLKVISLRNIPSSAACELMVSKFVTSYSQRVIICVADMSVCTQNEVNFFRKTIDKYLTRQTATRYICVVVLHFPPELELGSRPCYNAVFTNHWDYMYVDSLGVTIDIEDENQVLIDANPRTWIGKGFGLPLNISPISIEITFSELFYQLLQQICDGMDISPLDPRHIRYSETFYETSHNRFEFLKSMLVKFPFLHKGILYCPSN
jgi:hypothetical protein